MAAKAFATDEREQLSGTWASVAQQVAQGMGLAQAWHAMNRRWRRQK